MTERKRVEVDLEHFQAAFAEMNAALRRIEPAVRDLAEAVKNMNAVMRHLYESTQLRPETLDESDRSRED